MKRSSPPVGVAPRAAWGRECGYSTLELLLAALLAFCLVGMAGWMFRRQVHEFLDIREQARAQSGLKLALQAMTLEIANAGAMLPHPRESFAAQPGRLGFAYIDLSGRSCPEGSKAAVTFRLSPSGSADRILEEIACDGTPIAPRVLARAPRGKLGLAFLYYDKRGAPTVDPNLVHAVDLEITLQTAGPKAGPSFVKQT